MPDSPSAHDADVSQAVEQVDPDVDEAGQDSSGNDVSESAGGRDVEVPLEVYKAVTVFSTLFAVLAVVIGFALLDAATERATAAPEDVNILLAVAGLGAIGLGAVVYAFSTRFRAEGMGSSKDEDD